MERRRIASIRRALEWISGRLVEMDVPHQVVGGLAAIAHGGSRPLNDIDIYVPEGALVRLSRELADHVTGAPRRHRDAQWDCFFMELRFAGEEIELAEAPRTRYRKDPDHPWHEADVDFDRPVIREPWGVEVPVMPLERLLTYKRRLDRPVDREDLAELAP